LNTVTGESLNILIFSPMIVGLGKTPANYTSQQINLARHWADAGHRVDLVTCQQEGTREALDHPRIRVFLRPAIWLGGRKGIPLVPLGGWFQIRRGGYDLVLTSEHYSAATVIACLLSKRVVIYQGQNSAGSTPLKRGLFRLLELAGGPLVRRRHRFAVAKTSQAEAFLRDRGYDRCHMVPCGYDDGRFRWPGLEERDRCRQRLGLPADAPVWVYAGNLLARRDVATALRAFDEFRNEHPAARFLVAGEGPERGALERMAGEGDAVRFLGELPWAELWEVYAAGDLFVFPTRYEIYGMVLLEALGSGLPFVSTPCPAARDIIADCPEAGALFAEGDHGELLARAQEVLGRPPAEREGPVRGFLETMTWKRMAERILQLS
jgi:glycosyltransferase involved in cell wall biosynthesis